MRDLWGCDIPWEADNILCMVVGVQPGLKGNFDVDVDVFFKAYMTRACPDPFVLQHVLIDIGSIFDR